MVYLEIETKYLVSPKHIRESDPVNTVLGLTGSEVFDLTEYLTKYHIPYIILPAPWSTINAKLHS